MIGAYCLLYIRSIKMYKLHEYVLLNILVFAQWNVFIAETSCWTKVKMHTNNVFPKIFLSKEGFAKGACCKDVMLSSGASVLLYYTTRKATHPWKNTRSCLRSQAWTLMFALLAEWVKRDISLITCLEYL